MVEYIVAKFLSKFWKNSEWVAQVFCEQRLSKLWKNPKDFFKELPAGYIEEFFQSKFSIYPLGNRWVNSDQIMKELPGFFKELPAG